MRQHQRQDGGSITHRIRTRHPGRGGGGGGGDDDDAQPSTSLQVRPRLFAFRFSHSQNNIHDNVAAT